MFRGNELKRNSGYSLISVLVATAIVSIALSGVMFIVDLITTTVARNKAEDNVEGAVRTIQGIVANRDLCNNALRDTDAGTRIRYNPVGCATVEVPVPRIYLQSQDNDPNATQVLSTGGTVGFGYRVRRMALRERVACQGRGEITADGIIKKTYAAELVLEFEGDGTQTTVGALRARTVPISVVTHPGPDGALETADDVIDRCYQDSSAQYLCEQLGGSYSPTGGCVAILRGADISCQSILAGSVNDCPPDPPGQPANVCCQRFYYVVGFANVNLTRPNARPLCKCQRICRVTTGASVCPAYIGGPGTVAVGPGAGPGAGPGQTGEVRRQQ